MEPSSDHSIKAKDKRILAKYVEHVLVLVEILGYEAFSRKEQSSNASNAIDDKSIFTARNVVRMPEDAEQRKMVFSF